MSDPVRRVLLVGLLVLQASAATAVVDPMRPPGTLAQTPASEPERAMPVLNSTLIAPGRRIATIDGTRYRLGDAVPGGRLVAIEPTGVILERDGHRVRLELLPSRVRRPAGQ